jgi:hypothetical protein
VSVFCRRFTAIGLPHRHVLRRSKLFFLVTDRKRVSQFVLRALAAVWPCQLFGWENLKRAIQCISLMTEDCLKMLCLFSIIRNGEARRAYTYILSDSISYGAVSTVGVSFESLVAVTDFNVNLHSSLIGDHNTGRNIRGTIGFSLVICLFVCSSCDDAVISAEYTVWSRMTGGCIMNWEKYGRKRTWPYLTYCPRKPTG